MAIYTKTGDKGETSLANGKRVAKTNGRIEAYGTTDELNSCIGLLRASISTQSASALSSSNESMKAIDGQLQWIQNKLFNLGAELSEAAGEWITQADVALLERWIDLMQSELPAQHSFLLPAGSEMVCRCHVCRTVCRRAERRMQAIECNEISACWINRLSDYLFVLSRYIGNKNGEKEEKWVQ